MFTFRHPQMDASLLIYFDRLSVPGINMYPALNLSLQPWKKKSSEERTSKISFPLF